jgi:hypothetical protein
MGCAAFLHGRYTLPIPFGPNPLKKHGSTPVELFEGNANL